MDDSGYSLSEIKRFIAQVANRVDCEVVNWRQDPCDSHHFFIMARLRLPPPESAPVQLEVFLPRR